MLVYVSRSLIFTVLIEHIPKIVVSKLPDCHGQFDIDKIYEDFIFLSITKPDVGFSLSLPLENRLSCYQITSLPVE